MSHTTSFKGSVLAATGKVTRREKRFVQHALAKNHRSAPRDKLVMFVSMSAPVDVQDNTEVIALLQRELINGPLKNRYNDDESLLECAKRYLITNDGKEWIRSRFRPALKTTLDAARAPENFVNGNNVAVPGSQAHEGHDLPANDTVAQLLDMPQVDPVAGGPVPSQARLSGQLSLCLLCKTVHGGDVPTGMPSSIRTPNTGGTGIQEVRKRWAAQNLRHIMSPSNITASLIVIMLGYLLTKSY